MVPGDPGRAGPSVPRTVEEDPRLEPGSVTLLHPPIVENIVLGNLRSPESAIPVNVGFVDIHN